MCMNLDGGFLCTCDDGYQLLADNSTCEGEVKLLEGRGNWKCTSTYKSVWPMQVSSMLTELPQDLHGIFNNRVT